MNGIVIKNLNKNFASKQVLKNISLTIKPGERIALVGQNGSGKTTLIRCLLGLYEFAGSIEVFGYAPRSDRARVLQNIGFVPQIPPSLRMRVDEFLNVTESLCQCPKSSVIQCAESLGLDIEDCCSRPFKNLSGGMKQKLLIAAAMARQPKILIMDEPAASLDPLARAKFFACLSELAPNTAMLLSSHRVDEISGLVTRMIEMDSGIIALDDFVASPVQENLGQSLNVVVVFHQAPDLIKENLRAWDLHEASEHNWRGTIASADRFRFLSMLTRWSGLIQSLHLGREDAK